MEQENTQETNRSKEMKTIRKHQEQKPPQKRDIRPDRKKISLGKQRKHQKNHQSSSSEKPHTDEDNETTAASRGADRRQDACATETADQRNKNNTDGNKTLAEMQTNEAHAALQVTIQTPGGRYGERLTDDNARNPPTPVGNEHRQIHHIRTAVYDA